MKKSIDQKLKKPITSDFSAGLYDWSVFLTNFIESFIHINAHF